MRDVGGSAAVRRGPAAGRLPSAAPSEERRGAGGIAQAARRGEHEEAWRDAKRHARAGAAAEALLLRAQGVPETVVMLIQMINEASANIPNWG